VPRATLCLAPVLFLAMKLPLPGAGLGVGSEKDIKPSASSVMTVCNNVFGRMVQRRSLRLLIEPTVCPSPISTKVSGITISFPSLLIAIPNFPV
jgi:hypothetical protein